MQNVGAKRRAQVWMHWWSVFCAVLLVGTLLVSAAGCSKVENVNTADRTAAKDSAVVTVPNADGLSDESSDPEQEQPPENTDEEPSEAPGTAETTRRDQGVLSSNEEVAYYVAPNLKNPGNRTVTLFIWNVDQYKTVTYYYRDSLTVPKLLEGLAWATNWNLSAADVKYNSQKVTIWWSKSSSLYGGLPEKQAKDFMVFNQKDLDAAILDSVKKTIQENLGMSTVVCYADASGKDLKLSGVGVSIPSSTPYSRFADYA